MKNKVENIQETPRKIKKRKLKKKYKILLCCLLVLPILGNLLPYIPILIQKNQIEMINLIDGTSIMQYYLTPNPYSRPGITLDQVNSIVIHYTGNPNTSAKANRNYFENLKIHKTTYASSHYIVGLNGEIIQCLPLNEISYASNNRNHDTISIEICHPDASGKFTKETYRSLVALVATLCYTYNLGEDDIIRHYDVTGKKCPLYFVENENAWKEFKKDVMSYLETIKEEN